MDLGLTGKACIVTGGSRGIGYAVAQRLVAEGARVMLVARNHERLTAAANTLGCASVVADVRDADVGQRVVAECQHQLGGADVLVNAAGVVRGVGLDDLTEDDWAEQWETHVLGSMRMMQAAAPVMAASGWGRIVNVSSSSGKRPSTSNVAYAVAKAGQLSLSRAYADAYAPRGVLVNAVTPGPVASELWLEDGGLADQSAATSGRERDEVLGAAAAKIPLGRFGTPDEIANVIVFLCSQAAGNVAGAAWSVDGGSVASIL